MGVARTWGAAAAATMVAGAGCVAYGALIERTWFTLRRFTLPVLPPGRDDVRVLHLSDIHLMPSQERKLRWVEALQELDPQVIVNTGDNLSHPDSVGPLLGCLEAFGHLPGAFVLGSNDYFAPTLKNPVDYLFKKVKTPATPQLPWREMVAGFTDFGWVDVSNQRLRWDMGGVQVDLVGVDDPHLGYDRYDDVAGPAAPDADLMVGVVHAPYTRVLDAMAADGAGLIIAGHTHGGQLAVPFFGALVTNCDLDRRRAKGVTRWWPGANGIRATHAPDDAAWMHVSAGLGTSPFAPVRFACRPEASLLTLTARA